jgi:hypothetical protein
MDILLKPFEFLAHRLWIYCLVPLNFLLADYHYIVYALSDSCSSTTTILLRPFQFLARRLCVYCFGPLNFFLADYDYIVYALSV